MFCRRAVDVPALALLSDGAQFCLLVLEAVAKVG